MAISTKTHGFIDLIIGAAFIATPIILNNLDRKGKNKLELKDTTILHSLGVGILLQGIMTKFELGAVKKLPMLSHLRLDYGTAAIMMAAPWVLNLDKRIKVPLTLIGAASLGIALLTEQEPELGLNEIDDAFEEAVDHAALIA